MFRRHEVHRVARLFLVTTAVLSAGIAFTATGKVFGPYLLLAGLAVFGGCS